MVEPHVSIHAPTRGATLALGFAGLGSSVSIHAPTRGATRFQDNLFRETCFNPRTHTGCDICIVKHKNLHICFNPRTHTGCDKVLVKLFLMANGFNPRTHTGCDNNTLPVCVSAFGVSIHAPTRGATYACA